jgi:phage terminase large subunit-like protein
METTQAKHQSTAEEWAALDSAEQQELLASLSDEEALAVLYDWSIWARPDQTTPEGDWFCWNMISGRGAGKTRTGSETVRGWVEESPHPIRIALVAESAADVRDVMLEGESGLITISPPWNKPLFQPSKRRVVWPNGSVATCFSGDKPAQLRGPQFHKAWVDELAKFQYPDDVWDNLELGLRLGIKPQVLNTTTPRPIPLIKTLINDPDNITTTVSTYANMANLSSKFIKRILSKYEGTRLGRQELHAELLSDTPGALWTLDLIEKNRAKVEFDRQRIVIAVDPAVSSEPDSDETGIIVACKGSDRKGYVLLDASGVYSSDRWPTLVCELYDRFDADRVVAEKNNGGDLVASVMRTKKENLPIRLVHASKGKGVRAEPVAALYEQGRVKHVGMFAHLEDQLTLITRDGYTGRGSPDRADALVWAMTDLMLGVWTSTDSDDYEDSRK